MARTGLNPALAATHACHDSHAGKNELASTAAVLYNRRDAVATRLGIRIAPQNPHDSSLKTVYFRASEKQ
jgi:hypothetical protein